MQALELLWLRLELQEDEIETVSNGFREKGYKS